MNPDWISVAASGVAALCAAAAWHAARINATKLDVLHTQTDGRWQESMDEHGRAERAIGIIAGGKDERADNIQRLEEVRASGVLVTELPSEKRSPADEPS